MIASHFKAHTCHCRLGCNPQRHREKTATSSKVSCLCVCLHWQWDDLQLFPVLQMCCGAEMKCLMKNNTQESLCLHLRCRTVAGKREAREAGRGLLPRKRLSPIYSPNSRYIILILEYNQNGGSVCVPASEQSEHCFTLICHSEKTRWHVWPLCFQGDKSKSPFTSLRGTDVLQCSQTRRSRKAWRLLVHIC